MDGFKKALPFSGRQYRLFYSSVSVLGLIGLVYFMAFTDPYHFYLPTDFVKYVGMVTGSWGVILIMGSFKKISTKSFLGLAQEEEVSLVTTGLHGRMRHPIYTGTILLMLGMFVSVPSASVLMAVLSIFIYLPIGIYLEEKKLIIEFGEQYLKYKEEVKAIIPGLI